MISIICTIKLLDIVRALYDNRSNEEYEEKNAMEAIKKSTYTRVLQSSIMISDERKKVCGSIRKSKERNI